MNPGRIQPYTTPDRRPGDPGYVPPVIPDRDVILMLARSNAMHRLHLRAAVYCGSMRNYRIMFPAPRPVRIGTDR